MVFNHLRHSNTASRIRPAVPGFFYGLGSLRRREMPLDRQRKEAYSSGKRRKAPMIINTKHGKRTAALPDGKEDKNS